MKAKKLLRCLELVKSSVMLSKDVVILKNGWVYASDFVWWSSCKMIECDDDSYLVVSYSKLRDILKSLGDKDFVEIKQKNVAAIIKSGDSIWSLNLKALEDYEECDFIAKSNEFKYISGYLLLDTIKSLKHLMRTDLSRPGLLLTWISPKGEMIVGDGYRLGGRFVSEVVLGLEIPIQVVLEIGRILGIKMSEKVGIAVYENKMYVDFGDMHLITSSLSDSFELEWYERVVAQMQLVTTEIKISKSLLDSAISRVAVTAGMDILNVRSKGKDLLVLSSIDDSGQKSITEIPCHGILENGFKVNIKYFADAVKARIDEMLIINAGKTAVKVLDSTGWEILALMT